MRRKKRSRVAAITALAMTVSLVALADQGRVDGYVQQVLMTSGDAFGGCMAKLSVDPATVLPECRPYWISFSCSGHFMDPVRALRMYDHAQMAVATNYRVAVSFTDNSLHNGYCVASRIDVFK